MPSPPLKNRLSKRPTMSACHYASHRDRAWRTSLRHYQWNQLPVTPVTFCHAGSPQHTSSFTIFTSRPGSGEPTSADRRLLSHTPWRQTRSDHSRKATNPLLARLFRQLDRDSRAPSNTAFRETELRLTSKRQSWLAPVKRAYSLPAFDPMAVYPYRHPRTSV